MLEQELITSTPASQVLQKLTQNDPNDVFDILLLDQIGQQSRTTGGTHKEIQLQLHWCWPGDTIPALQRVNIRTEHQHRKTVLG